MTVAPTTTIRVPQGLHDALSRLAQLQNTSMASVIEQGMDRLMEDRFWRAMTAAMDTPEVAADIQADSDQWTPAAHDGLELEDWSWLT